MSNEKRGIDGLKIALIGDADGLNKALSDMSVSKKLRSLTQAVRNENGINDNSETDILKSLEEDYMVSVLNEIYIIVRRVDDNSKPEFEARCKECGKLLYKFEDNMSKGTFVIETHCGNCKKLRKTTHGTNKY